MTGKTDPPPPTAARTAYYEAAGSWAQDRADALRRSRRIAWIVAGAAALVALFEALALMLLTPLKTVAPYTLLVDRHTGFVQAIDPLAPPRIAGDTALTQSLLVQYVTARESYDIATVRGDYAKVALWSGGAERSTYVAGMQASNPASPIARYGRGVSVTVRVKSVSPIGGDAALVRFDTQAESSASGLRPIGSWVALVRYRFVGVPMRVEDRFANPLGFQVTRYRRDAEALPPPAIVAVPRDVTGEVDEAAGVTAAMAGNAVGIVR